MSTIRQIEANRRNAQKSTGPTSVTGKAVSSQNALKTGIHARSLVLPYENLADLELLIDEYFRYHRPATPEARALVDDLIHCEWSLRRLHHAETQMFQYQNDSPYRAKEKYHLGYSASHNSRSFSALQYRLDSTRRATLRALAALKQLRAGTETPPPPPDPAAECAATPSPTASQQATSPAIGFVLVNPSEAPRQPAPEPPGPAPDQPGDAGPTPISMN